MTDLPKTLRQRLEETYDLKPLELAEKLRSEDGAEKFLFRLKDGRLIETVLILSGGRRTLCLSTQVGCKFACVFCASGAGGFERNLLPSEMLGQTLFLKDKLEVRLTNYVFMGMGEPLDNLDNVLKACNIITAEWGLAISPRNVTVSSVGITPAVEEFLKRSKCNLTLSLYSPFADERFRVIPAERKYPAREVISVMKNYPLERKRRLSIAYVMIGGVNDTNRHLDELITILKGTGIRVNLLPYHHVRDDMNRPSPDDKMMFFKHNLVVSGISASVRRSRGADIFAACGLLASQLNKRQIL